MKKRQRGFTLIEILIVVIISAVLAALILPRFLGQTEIPYIAEAQQQLGAMLRGQLTMCDATACATNQYKAVSATTGWGALGMNPPESTVQWSYTCTTGGVCTAQRNSGDYTGATISLAINGAFDCDATGTNTSYGYDEVQTSGTNVKGCRIV